MLNIGSHISSSKGYYAMGKQAVKLGANTFAFFTRNPRGGKAKDIDEADVAKYLELSKEQDFAKIVAHASKSDGIVYFHDVILAMHPSFEKFADILRKRGSSGERKWAWFF